MSTQQTIHFVTRDEAAKYLEVGPRTVDYHIKQERLTLYKQDNGKVLLDREEVVALRRSRQEKKENTIARRSAAKKALIPISRLQKNRDERDTQAAIEVGVAREVEVRYQDLEERLQTLECVAGVTNRGKGLNRPYLLSLLKSATYRKFTPGRLSEEEFYEWKMAISAMDHRTTKYCLKNTELKELPLRMLQLGVKLADLAPNRGDRNEMLLGVRSLRYLLLSFSPPTPLIKADFPIPDTLSTIDALAIASLAR